MHTAVTQIPDVNKPVEGLVIIKPCQKTILPLHVQLDTESISTEKFNLIPQRTASGTIISLYYI